jgi:hypothetical protein
MEYAEYQTCLEEVSILLSVETPCISKFMPVNMDFKIEVHLLIRYSALVSC